VTQVAILSEGEDAADPSFVGDYREAAVGQGQLASAPDIEAEQRRQVDAQDDVMRDRQQRLTGVSVQQAIQGRGARSWTCCRDSPTGCGHVAGLTRKSA
jgi:hypothetical protein